MRPVGGQSNEKGGGADNAPSDVTKKLPGSNIKSLSGGMDGTPDNFRNIIRTERTDSTTFMSPTGKGKLPNQ